MGKVEKLKIYPYLSGFSLTHAGHQPLTFTISFLLPNFLNLEHRNSFMNLLLDIGKNSSSTYQDWIISIKIDDFVVVGYIARTDIAQDDIAMAQGSLSMIVSSISVPEPVQDYSTLYEIVAESKNT